MKRFILNPKILWYSLIIGFALVLFSLLEINNVIKKLRDEEIKQVEIWAKAVSRKADMVKETKEFYDKTLKVEQTKLQRFVEAYKIILSQDENADLTSSNLQFYTKIIMDNTTIPVIITDEFNNIQFFQNVEPEPQEKVLVGKLYQRFSHNKPLEYEVYGMKFKLYYTESNVFANLRKVTDEVMLSFLSDVTNNGVSVPVIITDSTMKEVIAYGNIDSTNLKSKDKLQATINDMLDDNEPIRISLPGKHFGYIIFQKNKTISLLRYFPLLYIFFFILFGGLLYLVLRAVKTSEQNLVWVGMSKETAHQLGTPISSLTAWVELLRANEENASTCEEMDKDIQRLSIISQRFSQIGSRPTLKNQNIVPIINNMVEYMSLRSPKKVVFANKISKDSVIVPLNQFLIEWTFENLFKNAIDAMEGNGNITVSMEENEKKIFIDVADTGKGMQKSMFKKIFQPGFTTKKRGWGLGLSFVKRIVEEYHNGKIYVKSSTVNVGTTIRVELNK